MCHMKDYILVPQGYANRAAGDSQKPTRPEMTSSKLQLSIQFLIRNTGLLSFLPTNTIQENWRVGSIYWEQ